MTLEEIQADKQLRRYIHQKWSDLREFGYPSLTQDEVAQQLHLAINGAKGTEDGLTVIGMFIKADLDKAGEGR